MDAYRANLRSIKQVIGRNETSDEQLNTVGEILFGSKWLGAFAADEFPYVTTSTPYAIVNTHPAPGLHWVAVCWTPEGTLLYDSFGRSRTQLIRGKKPKRRYYFSERDPEQVETQFDCGQRCLSFLWVCAALGYKKALEI